MQKQIEERTLKGLNGWLMLAVNILGLIAGIVLMIVGVLLVGGEDVPQNQQYFAMFGAGCVFIIVFSIMFAGLKVLAPNEAMVFTLFGKYHGTLDKDGFYFVNPFCVSQNPALGMNLAFGMGKVTRKLSLKAMTLNNDKQKVNDEEGNPIEISVVVIWRIKNCAKAVFAVDNYMNYISTRASKLSKRASTTLLTRPKSRRQCYSVSRLRQ